VVLSVEPLVYRIEFPPANENYSVLLMISSDTNSKPYYQYQEVPIEGDDQTYVEIPRHSLPHGGYVLQAAITQWQDGKVVPVAWSDPPLIILVP
jgi:hypothetical protein